MASRTVVFSVIVALLTVLVNCNAMAGASTSAQVQFAPVTIRRAASDPFKDGKRVEGVWSRADIFSGFVVPGRMDAAIDDSAVQFLYDDDFLYVSLKGYFRKGCAKRPVDRRLFRDNNFEIFFSPSKKGDMFRQFAFSQGALVYYGDCNEGAKRELRRPEGLWLNIVEADGCTTFNAKLPVSSLGLGEIRDGMEIAVFVARRNINFKEDYREESVWGAMPEKYDYGCMKYWGDARFSKDDGSAPRTVMSPHNNLKLNYFANPKFVVADRSWQIIGKGETLRRETMPMSRQWIIRTTGESYNFLKGVPQVYERDTEYTLEVRARAYGLDEAQMNILELYRRDSDGKICEGTSIAKHVILGKAFHTYYFPFKSTNKGRPESIFFYKWEPKSAGGCGLDVASIRLFKGKVSALDIRKVARSGRKAPVDAGIPIADNPYGASAVNARGLVINRHFRGLREVMELFQGTGVDVDILSTTALDQDIYMTDGDIDDIKKRLAGRKYDFYCILPAVAANIGAEVSSAIIDGVKNGAGLYYMFNANAGHFEKMLSDTSFAPLGSEHPLVSSYPGNLDRSVAYIEPGKTFLEGRFAKGRIIREQSRRAGELKYIMDPRCYGMTDFPFSSFADPVMLKTLLYVSGKDLGCVAAAEKTFWRAVDLTGMIRREGSALNADEALKQAKCACDVSGRYAVSLKSVDGRGRTVDWSARYFRKAGPCIRLKGERTSLTGDETAVFTVDTDAAADSATVRWTLEDFSGRIIESAAVRPGAKIEVPTKALFTNKGVVRAYLEEAGRVLAVARADIFARDRDWRRFENDFGVGIWGQGTGVSRDTYPLVDRQLERAGVLCQSLPIGYYTDGESRNLTLSMSSGLAVGGGYLGDGDWFYPKQIGNSNNRSKYGPINTADGRAKIAQKARSTAAAVAKYGPVAYTVCDEPNLSLRFTRDEPDEEPENVAEYRRRMESKYGTIAEYNRRHRCDMRSFADIKPVRLAEARRTGNFAGFIEWRNFNVDRWCEAIKLVSDSGREADPTLKLSLFNSFGQTAISGNDYWKLLTKAGLGFSHEYTSMVYMRRDAIYNFDEFYRSFRPDLRVWGFSGYNMNAAQIKFTPWWFAAHRYGGFTWFAVMDWDWRFIDQPTLAFTQDASDLKSALEDSRVQKGLGKLCLSYNWAARDVAMYYSHDSLLAATLLGKEDISYDIGSSGPLHDYMYSRQGLQYIFEDLLYQFDFVAPEQIAAGRLDGYKILFMPRIIALSDAEVAKLKAFAARGGRIVADQLPGDYDELGVKRASNPFTSCEVTVTGCNFDDLSSVSRKNVKDLLLCAGAMPVLKSDGIENVFGREAVHFTDGVNSVFMVLRMPMRSTDGETQTFVFPKKGHVYDARTGAYLGFVDSVTAAVEHASASVWSVLPEKVGELRIAFSAEAAPGRDLVADIALENAAGKGVFHVEVVPPAGECRFHMKRNIDSKDGKARFTFRMAENDVEGAWQLRVTDVMTGVAASRGFTLKRE